MFIAVSNAHGWGKAPTAVAARALAFSNSIHSADANDQVKVKVWPCESGAHVNGHGDVFGVEPGTGKVYQRQGRRWIDVAE